MIPFFYTVVGAVSAKGRARNGRKARGMPRRGGELHVVDRSLFCDTQGLNNYQLTYLISMSEDRLEPTTDGGRLDEKRLRREKGEQIKIDQRMFDTQVWHRS